MSLSLRTLAAALLLSCSACTTVDAFVETESTPYGYWEMLEWPPGTQGYVYGWHEAWFTNTSQDTVCAFLVSQDTGYVGRKAIVQPGGNVQVAGRGTFPAGPIQLGVRKDACPDGYLR